MSQSAVFLCLAGVKAFERHIQRIREVLGVKIFPSDHFRIIAHRRPSGFFGHFRLQHLRNFMVMQFDKHFVAHFDQQSDVVVSAEASIETEASFNRL